MTDHEIEGRIEQPFDHNYMPDVFANYKDDMQHLYDTSLRPYIDGEFLTHRLASQSRAIKVYPELLDQVVDTLNDDTDETIKAVADDLYIGMQLVRPASEQPVGTLLACLQITNQIAIIKNDKVGALAPNDRTNAIANLLGRKIVADIPEDEVINYLLNAQFLATKIAELYEAQPNHPIAYQYIHSKIQGIVSLLKGRKFGMAYAEATPGMDVVAPSAEQITQDSQKVSDAFTIIRQNQAYGIKLGYKAYKYGGSLIYSAPLGENIASKYANQGNLHHLTVGNQVAASIIHSFRKSFKTLKPDLVDIGIGAAGLSFENLDSLHIIHLGKDGELYSDMYCEQPMLASYLAQNKYKAYRDLQAEIIANYFDLTQTAERVDCINRKISVTISNPEPHENETVDTFQKLVIPRVRVFVETPEPSQEDPDSATEQQSKNVRLHGVVWHRRKLPEGWQASPEAVQLADELGIILQERETFVREHKRGNRKIGEVVAHKLVDYAGKIR